MDLSALYTGVVSNSHAYHIFRGDDFPFHKMHDSALVSVSRNI